MGPDELGEALGLVQEGLLKVVRFQLAMERRDRRVAMQTIDDVVHLEKRIARFVERDGAARPDSVRAQSLEAQRLALAREKLTLGAGVCTGTARVELAAEALVEPDPIPNEAVGAPEPAQEAEMRTAPCTPERQAGSLCARLICALCAVTVVATIGAAAMLEPQTFEALTQLSWPQGGRQ